MTASRAVSNRGQSDGPPEGAHLSRRENVVLSGSRSRRSRGGFGLTTCYRASHGLHRARRPREDIRCRPI